MFYDTLMAANEMNGYHFLSKKLQFHFLLNSVRKKKRFGGKWLSKSKINELEFVKNYYGYSNEKAREALTILSKKQIESIKQKLNTGGRKR